MGAARKLELNLIKNIVQRIAARWKLIAVCFVLLGIILTLALPGTVPRENIQIVNGQQYLGTTYAESSSHASVMAVAAQTNWSLGSSPTASAQLSSQSITTLTGTLKPDSSPTSLVMTQDLSINLTEYPILYVQIEVTQGVGYGIRFFSSVDNKTIPLWTNADVLDHRKGTGQLENIQLNEQLLSELNTGTAAKNITEMQIYVERGPSTSPTPFSVVIQKIEFLSYQIVTSPTVGSYHSVYFTFDNLPVNNASWILNKIDLGLQVSASPGATYVIYQFNGSSTIASTVFHYSPDTASYQYSLYPSGTNTILPDSLPPSGNYSLVVVALSGVINSVKLQGVSFVSLPAQTQDQVLSNTIGSSWWYVYLMLFLFVIPFCTAVQLYRIYRSGNEIKGWHVGAALAIGLGCRFALAPVAYQPSDLMVYATSARGWFDYATPSTSYGPTLPLTYFLYWIPYSFYALFLKLGFHDFFILNHQIGFFETIFLKVFPITADLAVCYLILSFDSSTRGRILAFFYFLNPLSIYISSVWGQYEAATIALVVLGFRFMLGRNGVIHEFKASLAFILSALVEVVGLIPLALLLAKSLVTRRAKIIGTLIVASPIVLLFVYPPEWHLIYLLFSGSVGASTALLFGNPHTPYTIFSNFPSLAAYHPLILFLLLAGAVFVARRKYEIQDMIAFTFVCFVIFLLFAGQEPQWWLFIVPLCIIYAIVSGKFALGPYMLVFGTLTAFLILSFTQGSGYMLFGSAKLDLLPAIENARHGIDIYTVTTTIGALVSVGCLLAGDRITSRIPLARSGSLILFVTATLSFFLFAIMGASI